MVGNCASYKQTDVIYRAEANKQFTHRALAKATTLRQSALSHAPYVDVFKAAIGDDFIIEMRKNWIQGHTKPTGPKLKPGSSVWLPPVFFQFDKDGDGTIDGTEFGIYVETLSWGEKPDEAKINQIMKNHDPTRYGRIDGRVC